jgi:alkyl hydroperoxide reductase subunit D
MPIPTPALDALRDTLPEEFKDTRLNLGAVLAGENLSDTQAWGTALAAARFLRAPKLAAAIEADIRAGLDAAAAPLVSDAEAAAGLMAMNTVYYRSRHMLGKESYAARPARLRMQRIAKPATDGIHLELMSLACAAIAGCEFCLQNHEAKLLGEGTSEDACHDCLRIAAVIAAAAVGIG